jgi:hypothetical protein
MSLRPQIAWSTLAVGALLASSLFLYSSPGENITLYWDSGTLFGTGIHIARTGSVVLQDPVIFSIPAEFHPLIYEFIPNSFFYARQFKGFGFYIVDTDLGIVTPQYLHLFPSIVAIGYSLLGWMGALYVQPLLAILSVSAFYLLAVRLVGKRYGILALALFSVGFVQVWFARFPSAEMISQLLLLGAVLSFLAFLDSKSPYYAALSATAFGANLLTRLDSLILVPIVIVLGILYVLPRSRRAGRVFFLFFSVMMSVTVAYYSTTAAPYVSGQFVASRVSYLLPYQPVILYGTGAIAIMLSLLSVPRGAEWCRKILNVLGRRLRSIVVLLGAATLAILYLTSPFVTWGYYGTNLLALGWYITDLGVILGFSGLFFLAARRPNTQATYVFLLSVLPFFLLYIPSLNNQPRYPWAMRRYIVAILPALILGLTIALRFLADSVYAHRHSIATRGAVVLTLIVLITANAVAVAPIIDFADNRGLIAQTEELVQVFEDNAIVLFHERVLGVAYTLQWVYGMSAYMLPSEPLSSERLVPYQALLSFWISQGRPVYIVNPSSDFLERVGRNFTLVLYAKMDITVSRYNFGFKSSFYWIGRDMQSLSIYRVGQNGLPL